MFLNPHPKGFSILAPPQMAMDAGAPIRKPRSSQRRTSSFDAAALMQRSDDNYVWTSRRAVTHSHDSAGGPSMSELRKLHGQIADSHASLAELLKSGRFSFRDAQGHALRIAESANQIDGLLGGASGKDTEADHDQEWEKARDSVGEVPAKSVVAPSGPSKVDHRKDFQGADSALLDISCLFQRGA